jgi:hypothetical protein
VVKLAYVSDIFEHIQVIDGSPSNDTLRKGSSIYGFFEDGQ